MISTKIKLLVAGLLTLSVLLVLWRLDHVTQELKTSKTTIHTLEQKNEAIKAVAVRSINRPRTDDDVTNRLCEWAGIQYEHETRKKFRLPNGPCN